MTASPQIATPTRARSLAMRMLGGEGCAAMHAYRLNLHMGPVAHGTHHERLLVACQPDAGWTPDEPIEVRLDLTLQAQQVEFAITTASVHLLGNLTWLTSDEVAELTANGLPLALDAALTAAGARLGLVETERAILHDFTGATAINLSDGFEHIAVDPWAAHDAAAMLTDEQSRDICWAALTQAIASETVSRPAPPMCAHVVGKAFVIDMDPHGVTLMLTGPEEVITVFAAFDTPASTALDFSWSIAQLVSRARSRL